MLESHNDSAVAIAEHVGGSVEKFAEMMNEKAKELGCEHTHFITPNGLDAKTKQVSMEPRQKIFATIMSYCIKNDTFLKITQTKQHCFQNVEGSRSFTCNNHNAFLQMMDGALSGKTGFTAEAGYCYVGALKRGERTFVVSLLACGWPNNKSYKWSDTKKLMEYGLEHYEKVKVKAKQELETVPVINAADNSYDPDKEILMPVRVKGKDLRVLKDKEEKSDRKMYDKEGIAGTGQKRNGDRKSRVLYRRGKSSILSDRCDGKCIRKNATVVSAVRLRKVSVLKFVRLEKCLFKLVKNLTNYY